MTTTNLKTTIHAYQYDVSKPDDAKAYAELCEKMRIEKNGGKE